MNTRKQVQIRCAKTEKIAPPSFKNSPPPSSPPKILKDVIAQIYFHGISQMRKPQHSNLKFISIRVFQFFVIRSTIIKIDVVIMSKSIENFFVNLLQYIYQTNFQLINNLINILLNHFLFFEGLLHQPRLMHQKNEREFKFLLYETKLSKYEIISKEKTTVFLARQNYKKAYSLIIRKIKKALTFQKNIYKSLKILKVSHIHYFFFKQKNHLKIQNFKQ